MTTVGDTNTDHEDAFIQNDNQLNSNLSNTHTSNHDENININNPNTNSININTNHHHVDNTVVSPNSPLEVQSNSVPLPPEVTTSVPLAVEASSNYLSVNGNATPGDRGEGGGVGDKTSSELPVADLREAEGEVYREAPCNGKDGSQVQITLHDESISSIETFGNIDVANPEEQNVLPGGTKSVNSEEQDSPLRTENLPGGTKDVNSEEQTSLPPVVTSTVGPTSVPLGVEPSSNYLPVNGNATPGDRGEDSDVTSGGEPAADLREAEGQLNREGTTPSGMISGGEADVRTSSGDVRNITSVDKGVIDVNSSCMLMSEYNRLYMMGSYNNDKIEIGSGIRVIDDLLLELDKNNKEFIKNSMDIQYCSLDGLDIISNDDINIENIGNAIANNNIIQKFGDDYYPESVIPAHYTWYQEDGIICRYITDYVLYNSRGDRLISLDQLGKNENILIMYCKVKHIGLIHNINDLYYTNHPLINKYIINNKRFKFNINSNELIKIPRKQRTFPIKINIIDWYIDYGINPNDTSYIWVISDNDIYYRLEKPSGRYQNIYIYTKLLTDITTYIIKLLQFNGNLTLNHIINNITNIPRDLSSTNPLSIFNHNTPEVQSDTVPLEVQSNSIPLGVEPSSNYLSVNGNATPGDRGDVYPEEQRMLTQKNEDVQPLRTGNLPGGTKVVNPEEQTSTEVQSNSLGPADSSPPEVTTSVPLAVEASSNYLSVNGKATPRDRGDVGGSVEDVTSSGIPGSDLRELEGEVNREGATPSGMTSSGEADGRTTSSGDVSMDEILLLLRSPYYIENYKLGDIDKNMDYIFTECRNYDILFRYDRNDNNLMLDLHNRLREILPFHYFDNNFMNIEYIGYNRLYELYKNRFINIEPLPEIKIIKQPKPKYKNKKSGFDVDEYNLRHSSRGEIKSRSGRIIKCGNLLSRDIINDIQPKHNKINNITSLNNNDTYNKLIELESKCNDLLLPFDFDYNLFNTSSDNDDYNLPIILSNDVDISLNNSNYYPKDLPLRKLKFYPNDDLIELLDLSRQFSTTTNNNIIPLLPKLHIDTLETTLLFNSSNDNYQPIEQSSYQYTKPTCICQHTYLQSIINHKHTNNTIDNYYNGTQWLYYLNNEHLQPGLLITYANEV